jgi:hypothetical protein
MEVIMTVPNIDPSQTLIARFARLKALGNVGVLSAIVLMLWEFSRLPNLDVSGRAFELFGAALIGVLALFGLWRVATTPSIMIVFSPDGLTVRASRTRTIVIPWARIVSFEELQAANGRARFLGFKVDPEFEAIINSTRKARLLKSINGKLGYHEHTLSTGSTTMDFATMRDAMNIYWRRYGLKTPVEIGPASHSK